MNSSQYTQDELFDNRKKVILIILEGNIDKYLFASFINELISDDRIKIEITRGDIFTKDKYIQLDGQEIIKDILGDFLQSSHLQIEDIKEIVQFCDTDGSYINEDLFMVDEHRCYPEGQSYLYQVSNEKVYVNSQRNKQKLLRNWNRKKQLQEELRCTSTISTIPYSIYYYSLNLEHLLSNEILIDYEDKMDCIDTFIDRNSSITDFISFFSNPTRILCDKYDSSWEKLADVDNHFEIGRSNLNVFFGKYSLEVN